MTYEKGGILLSEGTRTEIVDMNRFKTGLLHGHIEVQTAADGFPVVIANPLASRLKQSIRWVALKKAKAIAFDSFEPHMSGKNIHSSPRLAMETTYCEGKKRTKYLIKIGQLKD